MSEVNVTMNIISSAEANTVELQLGDTAVKYVDMSPTIALRIGHLLISHAMGVIEARGEELSTGRIDVDKRPEGVRSGRVLSLHNPDKEISRRVKGSQEGATDLYPELVAELMGYLAEQGIVSIDGPPRAINPITGRGYITWHRGGTPDTIADRADLVKSFKTWVDSQQVTKKDNDELPQLLLVWRVKPHFRVESGRVTLRFRYDWATQAQIEDYNALPKED